MISTATLPSIGPPPPEIRRPDVPENLKPKLPDIKEELVSGPRRRASAKDATSQPEARAGSTGSGNSQNLGGASAVAIQVSEGRIPAEPISPQLEDLPELSTQYSDEDLARISQLKARDREVRAHETAHASAGQGYTGAPSFEYATGPDGIQYAVGGHVSIDTKPVADNPEATISKMEVVRRAALAPARPSGQDRSVASAAEAAIREAEAQLQEQRRTEATSSDEPDEANTFSQNNPQRETNPAESASLSPESTALLGTTGASRPAQPVRIDLIA
ncbi:putative metalloprotease CJM1_0395 family protein [Kordiimonas sp.]|uniref:putative metalloprotease CJM1_0395 family protein n=1 Tax=Kordiimonas sp. TaxID=1970157 RepID=UPI003A91B581